MRQKLVVMSKASFLTVSLSAVVSAALLISTPAVFAQGRGADRPQSECPLNEEEIEELKQEFEEGFTLRECFLFLHERRPADFPKSKLDTKLRELDEYLRASEELAAKGYVPESAKHLCFKERLNGPLGSKNLDPRFEFSNSAGVLDAWPSYSFSAEETVVMYENRLRAGRDDRAYSQKSPAVFCPGDEKPAQTP